MNKSNLKVAGVVLLIVLALGAAAFFGSRIVSAQTAQPQQASEPGLVVVQVQADSPAAQAGVKRGDILLKVNGTDINSVRDLTTALKDLKPGDKATLTVLHGDTQKDLSVTLGDKNGNPFLGLLTWPGNVGKGIVVEKGGILKGAAGAAVIVSVDKDSPAEKAGLAKGDHILAVNGKDLAADNLLKDALSSLKPGDVVTLKVANPKGEEREVKVTLGDKDGKPYMGIQYNQRAMRVQLPDNGTVPQPKTFVNPRIQQPGVIVVEVVAGSPAETAGLKVKDVISKVDGTQPASVDEFVTAIGSKKPGDVVTLTVNRPGQTDPLEIKVTLGENPDKAGAGYLGVKINGVFKVLPNSSGDGLQLPGRQLPVPLEKQGVPGLNG